MKEVNCSGERADRSAISHMPPNCRNRLSAGDEIIAGIRMFNSFQKKELLKRFPEFRHCLFYGICAAVGFAAVAAEAQRLLLLGQIFI